MTEKPKDFKRWHERKAWLHTQQPRAFFNKRDVWWCSLGSNIGFEQDGKGDKFARPVLVFKKFNNDIFWAIPISLQKKKKKATVRFYAPLILNDGIERTALVSQLRLMDSKRLLNKIGKISEDNLADIQKAVIRLCE